MPTPNDDALRIEARAASAIYSHGAGASACPDAECADSPDWPALGEDRVPLARSSPMEIRLPHGGGVHPLGKTTPDDVDAKLVEGTSPSPSIETEPKDAAAAATSALHAPDPAATFLPRDPNPSPSTLHGLLPPPPRPLYTSSFLRPGSRFVGKQRSDRQVYKVEVTFKSVDIKESFLCGYLRIEGLTKDHPTLTTYFEGEIIGSKYTFQTKHEAWGASDKTDMQHWNKFPAWRPLANQAKRADFHYKNYMEKENLFMRWKEYFLVPDHKVREIHGASFEGFYYICFNQAKGTVSGIYFHAKSEKFQNLDLEYIHDMGGFAAIEFR